MTWNIVPECTSLVILGIILVYSRKGSQLPTLKNRTFHACLLITFCGIFSNILSTVMIYNYQFLPLWMTWLVTTIYFILTPLMGMAYFLYTMSIIYPEGKRLLKKDLILSIPGMLYAIVILINPFTGSIFNLTASGGYTRGPLLVTTYLIFYLYCLGCVVVTLLNYRRMKPEISRILAAFPLLSFLVIFFQQMYPDIILTGSAATCALLIIYLHLQNKQISLDHLTNLPNRQELSNMLALLLSRNPGCVFTLAVVSLRDFRQVNSTCGQQNGDLLLKEISQFFCMSGPISNVYRFTGDEFALLFAKESDERIEQCIRAIHKRMKLPWQVNDFSFTVAISTGVIQHTDPSQTLEQVITSIEYAIFQAKTDKYGPVCYCDSAMLKNLERRDQIVNILKEKLIDQSFEMYYQPIYEVSTGQFLYAESLMRINDTHIGPIYPSEFIPLAEETGLLVDITYVILDKVCDFISQLITLHLPLKCIHVNFSGIQFSQPNLAQKVLAILDKNQTPTHMIKIEFTESTLADTPEVVTQFSLEMAQYGIMMGLDDFGTGYSNVATVFSLPFATVKLDRSLINASMESDHSSVAVRDLVKLFKDLNMTVVAEGVESESQRQMVVDFGVDQIQGYYYSKPLSCYDMIEFMKQNKLTKQKQL